MSRKQHIKVFKIQYTPGVNKIQCSQWMLRVILPFEKEGHAMITYRHVISTVNKKIWLPVHN